MQQHLPASKALIDVCAGIGAVWDNRRLFLDKRGCSEDLVMTRAERRGELGLGQGLSDVYELVKAVGAVLFRRRPIRGEWLFQRLWENPHGIGAVFWGSVLGILVAP